MKLIGFFPADGVEGKLRLFDQQGRVIEQFYDEEGNPIQLGRWEWEPTFFHPSARPVTQYLQTVDEKGGLLRRSVLTVAGSNGRIDLQDRTKPVTAQVDQKHAEKNEKAEKAEKKKEPEPAPDIEPKVPKGKG